MKEYEQDGSKSPTRLDSGAGGEAYAGHAAAGPASSAGKSGSDTGQTSDDMKRYASDMTGRAKEQGRSMLEQQKEGAARQADSVSHAFRTAASQLQQEGQARTGQYVEMLAEQIESLGRQLREKDINTLVRQAGDLGRRAPATFFAGSLAAGFLLARFLKSSAQRQHGMAGLSDQQRYAGPWRDEPRPGAMTDAYGSPASEGIPANPLSGDLASPMTANDVSSTPMTATSAPATGNDAGSSQRSASGTGTSSTPLSTGIPSGGDNYGNR